MPGVAQLLGSRGQSGTAPLHRGLAPLAAVGFGPQKRINVSDRMSFSLRPLGASRGPLVVSWLALVPCNAARISSAWGGMFEIGQEVRGIQPCRWNCATSDVRAQRRTVGLVSDFPAGGRPQDKIMADKITRSSRAVAGPKQAIAGWRRRESVVPSGLRSLGGPSQFAWHRPLPWAKPGQSQRE